MKGRRERDTVRGMVKRDALSGVMKISSFGGGIIEGWGEGVV